jgi:hypothetical protein
MYSDGGIESAATTGSVLRQPFQAPSMRRSMSGTQPAPSSITPPRSSGKRSKTPSSARRGRKFCGAKASAKKSLARRFSPPPSQSFGRGWPFL